MRTKRGAAPEVVGTSVRRRSRLDSNRPLGSEKRRVIGGGALGDGVV
jgi:hypothetical protein